MGPLEDLLKEAMPGWVNPRLLGTLGGAAAGYLSAPEGETGSSALAGGAVGYMGGAALSHAAGLPGAIMGALRPQAAKPPDPSIWQHLPQPPPEPNIWENLLVKKGGFGVGVGIPGTPIGISAKSHDTERLPGMEHWVPRDMIERGFTGVRNGLDDQAIIDMEGGQNNLRDPALGALVGAVLAHYGAPNGGAVAKGLGATLGAGIGSMYNDVSRPQRQDQMQHALQGIHEEHSKRKNSFPVSRQTTSSASAAAPMLIASAE
jgi:hypothetical protein